MTISRLVNAFFRWEFNSCETIVKDGVASPIDYANASPDVALTSLHYYFPWAIRALVRWTAFCSATGRQMRINQTTRDYFEVGDRDDLTYEQKLAEYRRLADAYFQVPEYDEFCATKLPHLDEILVDWVEGPGFDGLLVDTVTSTFPQHEHEQLRRSLPRPPRRVGEGSARRRVREYVLERTQVVPVAIEDAFAFFSDARNLERITPPWLRFRIDEAPAELAGGARLRYRLSLFGIPIRWRTEIVEWRPPHGFVDVQRRGPFLLWEHAHRLARSRAGPRSTTTSATGSSSARLARSCAGCSSAAGSRGSSTTAPARSRACSRQRLPRSLVERRELERHERPNPLLARDRRVAQPFHERTCDRRIHGRDEVEPQRRQIGREHGRLDDQRPAAEQRRDPLDHLAVGHHLGPAGVVALAERRLLAADAGEIARGRRRARSAASASRPSSA